MVDLGTQISLAAVPLTGVDALLQESQTTAALIVQRRSLSTLSRAFTGDTSHTCCRPGSMSGDRGQA